MQQHIPAWKRIGLKLKYAKDSIDPPYQDADAEINRTANGNHELSETTNWYPARPLKKRKLSPDAGERQRPEVARTFQSRPSKSGAVDNSSDTNDAEEREAERRGWKDTSEEDHNQESLIDASTRPVQQSRRKSVTFTPETKQDDGFSASNFSKQWFQNQSSGQSQAESPPSDSTPTQNEKKAKRSKTKGAEGVEDVDSHTRINASTSTAHDTEPTSTRPTIPPSCSDAHRLEQAGKTNAPKKKKSKDKSNEPKAIPSSIEYLRQFSQDRAAWRFNKKKQTNLLKNLFDIHLIPSEHDQVIVEYISGLQGEAARQRLIETATSILHSIAEKQDDFDMQGMESEEARRRAYGDALKKEIMRYERTNVEPDEADEQQLADLKREIERGQRAEAVLFKLLERELRPERHAQSNATPQQAAKTSNLNGNREVSVPTTASASLAAGIKRVIATEDTPATGLKRRKRKTRTASPNDDSSSPSSDSDSDSETNTPPIEGPRSVREALTTTTSALNAIPSSKKSSIPSATGKGKKTFFDDDLLDKSFPQEKTYHDTAPKRRAGEEKGRGFHYTHGALADESGSESE